MSNKLTSFKGLKSQRGFTFVELAIAMALFSFVLLVLTSGVIKLFHIYQAGVGIRNTQQAARLITDDLVRNGRKAVAYKLHEPTAPADLVNVKVNGGISVPQEHDGICFYTIYGGPSSEAHGTMFYTVYDGPNRFNIFRARIQNPVCSPGNIVAGTSQRLNPKTVSVLKFDAFAGPTAAPSLADRVVRFNMLIGADTAIQPEDLEQSPPPAVTEVNCRGQKSSQFCSTTFVGGGVGLRDAD